MTFSLDGASLMEAVGSFLASFQPYTLILVGLVVGAGVLYRGLDLLKWAGR